MQLHTIFYSGKEKGTGEFWVAFVVERITKRNVLDFKAVGERMCIVRIKTKFHNLHLISVLAPTEEKGAKEKEAFNQNMEEAYDICPSNDINSTSGGLKWQNQKRRNLPRLIGRHSLHLNTHNNGQRLVDFAAMI